MPINLVTVNRLLGAIAEKNVVAITTAQITIPHLAKPYTQAQLQTWLDKRVTQLNSCKTYTDVTAINARTTLYNQLTATAQQIADKVIAHTAYTLPDTLSDTDYDRLIGVILITYSLI